MALVPYRRVTITFAAGSHSGQIPRSQFIPLGSCLFLIVTRQGQMRNVLHKEQGDFDEWDSSRGSNWLEASFDRAEAGTDGFS
jgi:hypothetical protein